MKLKIERRTDIYFDEAAALSLAASECDIIAIIREIDLVFHAIHLFAWKKSQRARPTNRLHKKSKSISSTMTSTSKTPLFFYDVSQIEAIKAAIKVLPLEAQGKNRPDCLRPNVVIHGMTGTNICIISSC